MSIKIWLVFPLCATCFAPARAIAQSNREQDARLHAEAIVVVAPTTVRSKKGKLVRGMHLQDFELYDNDTLQDITADISDEPISLVVAVQRSANLQGILPIVQRVGSILNDLVAGSGGEVALIGFDHRVQVAQDFTNETAKISKALKDLTLGNSSHALVQVVTDATRMLRARPQNRRRVLLVIAEKGDKGSDGQLGEALANAQNANVTIYSVDISRLVALNQSVQQPPPLLPTTAQHLPAGAPLTPTTIDQNYYLGNYVPAFIDLFKGVKNIFVDDTLDVFTRFTGGRQYSFVNDSGLEKALENISEELHCQYVLSYVPNNQDESGFHEIRVLVRRPGIETHTRLGYWLPVKTR